MSLRCNICGKEVSGGEGYETSYGFVCSGCYNARNFQLCAECGRRFPRDDMLEWHGLLYCRSDYFSVKARYERMVESDRKKKAEREERNRPAPAKAGGMVSVGSRERARLPKEDIRGLIGEINKTASPKHRKLEIYIKKVKQRETAGGQEEKADDMLSIMKEIDKAISGPIEEISDSTLGPISLSKKGKEKRKDDFSELLGQLNSFVRGKE